MFCRRAKRLPLICWPVAVETPIQGSGYTYEQRSLLLNSPQFRFINAPSLPLLVLQIAITHTPPCTHPIKETPFPQPPTTPPPPCLTPTPVKPHTLIPTLTTTSSTTTTTRLLSVDRTLEQLPNGLNPQHQMSHNSPSQTPSGIERQD